LLVCLSSENQLDHLLECPERAIRSNLRLKVGRHAADITSEHHPKMTHVFLRDPEIHLKTGSYRAFPARKCDLHGVCENAETFFRYRSEDSRTITEVVIRSLVTHTRLPSDITHRDRIWSLRGAYLYRRIQHQPTNIHLTSILDNVKYMR
jgi:hypothetical protein